MTYKCDDKLARLFAVDWAVKNSNGKIANLARSYLRLQNDLEKALGVIKQRSLLPDGGSERALLNEFDKRGST